MDLAGDAAREITQQIERGAAELIERHASPQWRVPLLIGEHETGIADTGAGQRADRPGRYRVHANRVAAEIDSQVAHRCFQRRLGEPHGVVVRHRSRPTVVGERDHRAAVGHQRRGALGRLGERETRNQHGADEVRARRVGVAALELAFVGERDRVHQEIKPAPFLADRLKHLVDGCAVFDIAGQHQLGTKCLRERPHPLAECLALIGEAERRAMCCQTSRDAPGDRVVVGDPHDQPALALHQSLHEKPHNSPAATSSSADASDAALSTHEGGITPLDA